MVNKTDEKIYFPKSFNEQMAIVGAEVEHIIKYNSKFNIKKRIQEEGRASYGKHGCTHKINRIFEIVKSDPKNKAVSREIYQAERELIEYLYDEKDALSDEQIYGYWNSYLQSYIAELESHPIHFALVKGFDAKSSDKEENNELIGIYDSIEKLEDAYIIAFEKLEERHKAMIGLLGNRVDYVIKHEKVMIHAFDEFLSNWHYDISPEQLFWREKYDKCNVY